MRIKLVLVASYPIFELQGGGDIHTSPLREAAKRVSFLATRRGEGGLYGCATKEKRIFLMCGKLYFINLGTTTTLLRLLINPNKEARSN